ncbi:palmitoyltransferase ZDHHC13-like, partial [Convolutriloba macropyga]|uniref:palmitoyltransferase ZDHHC13-like n=1 Tax=Convolutriloba macropyga TaxID=536237 RepID=UPI003F51F4A0
MLLSAVKTRSKQLLTYKGQSHLKEFLGMRNKSMETALHIAVSSNQLSAAKVLLENGASAMEIQLDNMYYPIHLAAQNGELPMMEAIFDHALLETKSEQKVVNVTNRDLQTPLHRAVMFNRVHCAEFLLEKSKREGINMQEKDGFTPLLLAVSHGHLK